MSRAVSKANSGSTTRGSSGHLMQYPMSKQATAHIPADAVCTAGDEICVHAQRRPYLRTRPRSATARRCWRSCRCCGARRRCRCTSPPCWCRSWRWCCASWWTRAAARPCGCPPRTPRRLCSRPCSPRRAPGLIQHLWQPQDCTTSACGCHPAGAAVCHAAVQAVFKVMLSEACVMCSAHGMRCIESHSIPRHC